MHIMVIIDHPWIKSFNHAILNTLTQALKAAGHEVDVLDLHQDQFDPVTRVEELAI
jgi:NAD(P)H dehydrogenase (quinone)